MKLERSCMSVLKMYLYGSVIVYLFSTSCLFLVYNNERKTKLLSIKNESCKQNFCNEVNTSNIYAYRSMFSMLFV